MSPTQQLDLQIAAHLLADDISFATARVPEGVRLFDMTFATDQVGSTGLPLNIYARGTYVSFVSCVRTSTDELAKYRALLDMMERVPLVRANRDVDDAALLWVRTEVVVEDTNLSRASFRAALASVVTGLKVLLSSDFLKIELIRPTSLPIFDIDPLRARVPDETAGEASVAPVPAETLGNASATDSERG